MQLLVGSLGRLKVSASIEQEPRVRLRQLGKTFVGDDQNFTAVEAVDLDIGRDDFFCLLGPSGCGKTTILNLSLIHI